MSSSADATGGRAALPSAPGSTRGPILWPRTPEGAHQRLDYHEARIEDIIRDIGEEPAPVSGKEGSGLMLFLHRVHVGQTAQRTIEEAEVKSRERWRMRWTLLATIFSVIIAGATIVSTIRAWVQPPAPSAAHP